MARNRKKNKKGASDSNTEKHGNSNVPVDKPTCKRNIPSENASEVSAARTKNTLDSNVFQNRGSSSENISTSRDQYVDKKQDKVHNLDEFEDRTQKKSDTEKRETADDSTQHKNFNNPNESGQYSERSTNKLSEACTSEKYCKPSTNRDRNEHGTSKKYNHSRNRDFKQYNGDKYSDPQSSENSTSRRYHSSEQCREEKYRVSYAPKTNEDYSSTNSRKDKRNDSKITSGIKGSMSDEQGAVNKYWPIFYSNNSKTRFNNDDLYNEFEKKHFNRYDMNFKVVKETFGDLFTAGTEYSLGHCVAADMAMGSGIAVNFRRDFKRVDELLNQRKTQGEVAILEDQNRFIYYLVTKRISSGKPTYLTLWSSLHRMRIHIISNQVKKLALPRIGCGLDGLEWDLVKKMLEFIFGDDDIEILIFNFQQGPDDAPPQKMKKCPVVNVPYPISEIESGTIIVCLGSEDGYETQELNTIAEKFPAVRQRYRMEKKQAGKFIFLDRYNDGFAFYIFIVHKKRTDPIDFTYFQNCLNAVQTRNRREKYEYVAFQAFFENDDSDGLTVSKLLNLMRHSLTFVHIYVCWPDNLQSVMPRS